MISDLTKPQLIILKTAYGKIVKMDDFRLKQYRDFVVVSDVDMEVRELIIEGIDAKLNRKDLINIALSESSEIIPGYIKW